MLRLLTRGLVTLRFGFATTKPSSKYGLKDEEDEDITLAFFYRRLLRNTRVKPNGNSKFNAFDLHYMARLAEEPHEADLLLEAYYNLLGHNTKITHKTVDLVVQRCIEINPTPDKVLDLYENHHLLRYFPHYSTTEKLVGRVSEDSQKLQRFVKILAQCPFIKLSSSIASAILQGLQQHGLKKEMRRFFLEAVSKVPEAQQQPSVLRFLEGM